MKYSGFSDIQKQPVELCVWNNIASFRPWGKYQRQRSGWLRARFMSYQAITGTGTGWLSCRDISCHVSSSHPPCTMTLRSSATETCAALRGSAGDGILNRSKSSSQTCRTLVPDYHSSAHALHQGLYSGMTMPVSNTGEDCRLPKPLQFETTCTRNWQEFFIWKLVATPTTISDASLSKTVAISGGVATPSVSCTPLSVRLSTPGCFRC